MTVTVELVKRRSGITVAIWILLFVGMIFALTIFIIGLVYLNTNPITATMYLTFLLLFHNMALGATFASLFTLFPKRQTRGKNVLSWVIFVLYCLAITFDILGVVFYGSLGFTQCEPSSYDSVVSASICSNNQWILWVFFAIFILLAFHAAVGGGIFLIDNLIGKIEYRKGEYDDNGTQIGSLDDMPPSNARAAHGAYSHHQYNNEYEPRHYVQTGGKRP